MATSLGLFSSVAPSTLICYKNDVKTSKMAVYAIQFKYGKPTDLEGSKFEMEISNTGEGDIRKIMTQTEKRAYLLYRKEHFLLQKK